jgi:hypothetical protein
MFVGCSRTRPDLHALAFCSRNLFLPLEWEASYMAAFNIQNAVSRCATSYNLKMEAAGFSEATQRQNRSMFWDITPCSPVKVKPTFQRFISLPSSGPVWNLKKALSFMVIYCLFLCQKIHLFFVTAVATWIHSQRTLLFQSGVMTGVHVMGMRFRPANRKGAVCSVSWSPQY